MKLNTDHPEYIDAFAYVKRSKNRQQVIQVLSKGRKTPNDIVEKMDARFSLISRTLSELKDKNIVECINEQDRVGRIYRLTDIGIQISEELENAE